MASSGSRLKTGELVDDVKKFDHNNQEKHEATPSTKIAPSKLAIRKFPVPYAKTGSKLDLLPDAVKENFLSPMLKLEPAGRIAQTCKTSYNLFQRPLTEARLSHLLGHVARGEQEQAEAILKENPHLLMYKGHEAIDHAGRVFKNVTAFQLALWAYDRHMWDMLLKYFPQDETGARKEAAQQLQELESEGIEYQLRNAETKQILWRREAHYDFALKDALQEFVNYFDREDFNWAEANKLWCTRVGVAQSLVPAHIANEYCRRDRSFYPVPDFDEADLPRECKLYIPRGASWFPVADEGNADKLGINFAIIRWAGIEGRVAGLNALAASSGSPNQSSKYLKQGFVVDLAAVTALFNTRARDYKRLNQYLLNPTPVTARSDCPAPSRSICVN